MQRMTNEQLAAQKCEGSFARQDAIMAARRRVNRTSEPFDPAAVDRIINDVSAKDQAAFDAILSAIDAADTHGSINAKMMKAVARSALKASFPERAVASHAIAAE